MKLTLTKNEIEKAIVDFVAAQGINLDNTSVHVALLVDPTSSGVSATIDISTGVSQTPAAAPAPVPAQTAPTQVETDDVDREAIKAELTKRGIEFAPKAHTGTLQTLLEEALAADQVEEAPPFALNDPTPVAEEPVAAAVPAADPDDSPFGQPAKSAEPVPVEAEKVADEEKPLFGG